MAEQKSQGAIGFKIYFNYFAACRNWALVFLMAFLFIVTQMFASLSDYWCSKWQVTFHHVNQFVNQLTIVNSKFLLNFFRAHDEEINRNKTIEEIERSRYENIYIFSGTNVFTIVVSIIRSYMFFYVCMLASKNLHNDMFSNIICAPMRFFYTNPSGRILNRFSKDMGSVDEMLPSTMIDCFQVF